MYIIYGKNNCPWCDRAKELLDGDYIFKNVETDLLHRNDYMEDFPGSRTVPKIIEIEDDGTEIRRFQSYDELHHYIYATVYAEVNLA